MERATKQRATILQTLHIAGRPLLPQELLQEAQKEIANLSLATVYRNLKHLLAEGTVVVVQLPGQSSRYELCQPNASQVEQYLFQCKACQKVIDIDAIEGKLRPKLPKGYVCDAHQLTVFGRCAECADQGRHA